MKVSIKKAIPAGLLAAATFGMLAVPLASSAEAKTIYNGDDIAYTYSSDKSITVCDLENDDNSVYVKVSTADSFQNQSKYKVWDAWGDGCSRRTFSAKIIGMQFCEDRNFWEGGDKCASLHTI